MARLFESAGRLRLRPTMLSDLDFVISVEQDPANRPFITPWNRTQHEEIGRASCRERVYSSV